MKNIEITETSRFVTSGDGALSAIFEQRVDIPVYRQFQRVPFTTITVTSFSENAMPADRLSWLQAQAAYFRLEERRPEDRSGPRLYAEFNGLPFHETGLEIGEETHDGTRARAAEALAQTIMAFRRQ